MTIRVNPIDKHVGSRFCRRRLMLNKSQTEIADAPGLTFQQVQKYERGINRISASRLQRLCRILQVPVAFFFEGAPPAHGLPELSEAGAEVPAYVSDFLATSDPVRATGRAPRVGLSRPHYPAVGPKHLCHGRWRRLGVRQRRTRP
jgi:transcriptional regulator with XRE-family HTH domain